MPPSRPLETSMEATVASISLTGWVRAFQTTGLGPDGAVKTARGWFILTWEPWAHRGPVHRRERARRFVTFRGASTLKADGGAWKTLCAHNVSPFASFIQRHGTQSYHFEQGKRPIWVIECCEFIAAVHAVQFLDVHTHTSCWFVLKSRSFRTK